MWRTLLADRMKLSAHYDIKELQSYELVLARADGKLGPNLRPSRLDCTQPQAPPKPMPGMDIKQMSLSFCGRAFNAPDGCGYRKVETTADQETCSIERRSETRDFVRDQDLIPHCERQTIATGTQT